MKNKLSINQKILIPVLILLAITISITTVLNINSQKRLIEDEEQQRLLTLNAAFQNTVEDREQMAVALATAFAEMSTVQQAFAEHNREALITMLHSSYLQLDEKYGIPQSQFHLAPATSFLRLHSLEKFDDDLSAFRNTVLAANRELTPISGLEKGKAGYGVRGVVPVFYAGEHVGSFEMGMNFDEGLLLAFQAAYGPDVSVYFRDDLSKVDSFEEEEGTGIDKVILYPLYATTMEEPVGIDEQTKSIVFENDQSVTVRLEHGGMPFAIIIAPVHDYTGDVVGVVEIGIPRAEFLEQMAQDRNSAIITGIVSLLIIFILVQQIISRTVLRPLIQLESITEKVALGDFSVDMDSALTNRADKIGQLARSSASLTESIRAMVTEISSGIHILSSSASDLTAISEETTAGGKELAERTNSISAAAEELSVNTNSVATGMGETSTNLDAVASAVEEMSATIEEIASNSETAHLTTTKATDQTEQFAKVMKELGGAAQEISQVTETITSISAQTNLLALNATIEAARAGAAGKGFAVVANEIKELAQQTANATEDIKHKIGGIQNATAGAVTDLEQIVEVIEHVNEIVLSISSAIQQQSTATQDVAANIVEASSGMKEASERTAQTATATDSIARDIAEADHANTEMASTNLQVQKSAEELAQLSEKLNQLASQYKV